MNYKDILNKNVISIFDGTKCGKVDSGIFNKNGKLVSLLINQNEIKSIVNYCDVFSTCDDVMIKNKHKIIVSQNENPISFLNKEVFTIFGKYIGNVLDIVINEKLYIEKIITDKQEFSINDVITNNEVIVINDNSNHKKHNFAPKNKIEKAKNVEQKVVVATKVPIKVESGSFLLGKKLFRDFVTKDGITLARRNSLVTISLINAAKERGSLFDLLNCVV